MATLPAFLLCPGLLASRSFLLAPLTPLKLEKPAVCQACPDRNTYCFPIAEEAGERVLEKGFKSYKGPARVTRDNLREGSRREKGCISARMKELRQTGRQRLTGKQTTYEEESEVHLYPPSPMPPSRRLRKIHPCLWPPLPHLLSDLKLSA